MCPPEGRPPEGRPPEGPGPGDPGTEVKFPSMYVYYYRTYEKAVSGGGRGPGKNLKPVPGRSHRGGRVTVTHWRRPEQVSSLCLPVCLSLDTRGRGDRKQAVATPFLAQAKAGQADK